VVLEANGFTDGLAAEGYRQPGLFALAEQPAPLLGQHTREVLAEFGFSSQEIEALLVSGAAVASASQAP